MRSLLIMGFVALTSVGSYLYGKEVLRLPNRELANVCRITLECMWLSLVFLVLNLLVAFMVILASRVVLGSFISLYEASDVTLLIFSLFQGTLFRLWWRSTC
jgi:hypothetical protein